MNILFIKKLLNNINLLIFYSKVSIIIAISNKLLKLNTLIANYKININ